MEELDTASILFRKALKLGWTGTTKQNAECGDLLIQAAQLGHTIAQFFVSLGNDAFPKPNRTCFKSVPEEYEFDRPLLFKMAEEGNVEAQWFLGRCLFYGHGVAVNYLEGFKWSLLAAEKGFAPAQATVGFSYFDGEGVDWSREESHKWFFLAAQQGHFGMEYNVGRNLFHGFGVKENKKEGLKWWHRAADHGCYMAHLRLGEYYFKENDLKEATKWMRVGEEEGNQLAQFMLGILLLGLTFEDADEAKELLWNVALDKMVETDTPNYEIFRKAFLHLANRKFLKFHHDMTLKEAAAKAYWEIGVPSLQALSGKAVLNHTCDTADSPASIMYLLTEVELTLGKSFLDLA